MHFQYIKYFDDAFPKSELVIENSELKALILVILVGNIIFK